MDPRTRDRFDSLVDEVLDNMPPIVHELIERVPLHVEDHPPEEMLKELGVTDRRQLCGLFTGIPIEDHSIMLSGNLPDVVTIYREGILTAAMDDHGRIDEDALYQEIYITILHELGHYHGLDEDELAELGYG